MMGKSLTKALLTISTLSLGVIAVQLVPFSREKELSNHCREWYAMTHNQKNALNIRKRTKKSELIAKKAGLVLKDSKEIKQKPIISKFITSSNVFRFCNSFYFNQE